MEDLKKDDYELCLKELKSQRVSVMLQLAALEGSIGQFTEILRLMKDEDREEKTPKV